MEKMAEEKMFAANDSLAAKIAVTDNSDCHIDSHIEVVNTTTLTLADCHIDTHIEVVNTTTLTLADGYYYGNNVNQLPHGYGVMHYYNGDSYYGQWQQGFIHGCGTFIFAAQGYYQGEFFYGQRHGQGYCTWSNGQNYWGQWEYDQPNGEGILLSLATSPADVTGLVGLMQAAGPVQLIRPIALDAYAIPILPRGVIGHLYRGEMKNGLAHGEGLMRYADRSRYCGRWSKGEYEGSGTLMQTDGQQLSGFWSKGRKVFLDASEAAGTF